MTDMMYPLHPEGLHKVLRRACSYGIPLIITETGAATRDDGVRAKAIDSYFKQVGSSSCCSSREVQSSYHTKQRHYCTSLPHMYRPSGSLHACGVLLTGGKRQPQTGC